MTRSAELCLAMCSARISDRYTGECLDIGSHVTSPSHTHVVVTRIAHVTSTQQVREQVIDDYLLLECCTLWWHQQPGQVSHHRLRDYFSAHTRLLNYHYALRENIVPASVYTAQ